MCSNTKVGRWSTSSKPVSGDDYIDTWVGTRVVRWIEVYDSRAAGRDVGDLHPGPRRDGGEHRMLSKMVTYEPAVMVPVIIRPPRGCNPRVVTELVEHLGLAATTRSSSSTSTRILLKASISSTVVSTAGYSMR
jgi:hypothetical protein